MFVYNIVLIGIAVSPALSSAVGNLATTSTCRGSEFTCLDGTCIRGGAVCDTYEDCPDGSDEASCYSSTNSRPTRSAGCELPRYPEHGTYVALNDPSAKPGENIPFAQLIITCEPGYGVVGNAMPYCLDGNWFTPMPKCVPVSQALSSAVGNLATTSTCRGSEFTCLDGTCIRGGAVCDTYEDCPDGSDEASCYSSTNSRPTRSAGCELPQYPEHGTYVALNDPTAKPGQNIPYAQLVITCEPGYGVVRNAMPYSLDGNWYTPMQKCVPFCRLKPDVSVRYKCQVLGTDDYRDCNEFEPSGTLVKPECNTPIYDSRDDHRFMKCQIDGRWNRIIKCKPACGRVTPEAEGLISGGKEAIRGEMPWHVAIYRKPTQRKNYYEQICGGTLVSNRIVISAAHCFWDNNKDKMQPASNYAVATAKLYREWDHEEDKDAQKSELKSLKFTPYYRGVRTNFQHDIAVLILETPFVYYSYVRPVCLDLDDLKFNDLQLQMGKFGKVAGWGLTDENGPASPALKVVQLPYVPIQECMDITPENFTESITGDKICAGYRNGTAAVCKGDSGGGLSFPTTERGMKRYYLRGIVSTAPRGTEKCNVFTVTTFTAVYQHKDFINQFISTTCTLPSYPDNGYYEVVGDSAAKPGDDADIVNLTVSCNHGHIINGNNVVTCILGEWSSGMPECVQPVCVLGPKGKCMKETGCLTSPDEDSSKHPICYTKGGESISCTDCQLADNTDAGATQPRGRQGLSHSDCHVVFLNTRTLKEEWYNNVVKGNYDTAVNMVRNFESIGGEVINEILTRLISSVPQQVMALAYKLWNGGAEDIVRNYFPQSFQHIFNLDVVTIINEMFQQPLILDKETDFFFNDRLAWGGHNQTDISSQAVGWRFLPVWRSNQVIFVIRHNVHYSHLKLDILGDSIGDRKAWGSPNNEEDRHRYYLQPTFNNCSLVFFIVNYEYKQVFKLAWESDGYGNRQLWGHHGSFDTEDKRLRWVIAAWKPAEDDGATSETS